MCIGISFKSARFDPFEIRSGPPSSLSELLKSFSSERRRWAAEERKNQGGQRTRRPKRARSFNKYALGKAMAEIETDDDVS